MWCLSCFKPSNNTVEDTVEAETDIALEVSLHDAEIQEAQQLSLALESSRLRQQEDEEERLRRNRALENDEQLARAYQYEERETQIAKTVEKSLKEKDKGKDFEENNNISIRASLDEEDEQRVIWESLRDKGKGKQTKDEMDEDEKLREVIPPRSICGGFDSEIERERSVDISGVLWHPECLWCDACHKPIAINEVENHVSNARGKYHKSCYERFCYICKEKKMRKYNEHHFWKERYCPSHESDGTHKCCSCERLEPRETNYVMLGDTRWLCLECMESAVMDSHECQPLHFEIREYFEGLNMKIEKEFPFLLVEKQALNKAEKEEKIDYQYEVVTRGICLSEAQTVTSVSKVTRTGPRNELIEKVTESQPVYRDCEVTAILILYGLPRLLTGYILAHEMMHAYLRLNGHKKLNKVREEGICQVLGHMWLESQTYASTDAAIAPEASSSSSRTPLAAASASSKKGKWTGFEKRLVEFCKNQIETDESPVYGDGFRKVNKMVMNSNLKDTLKEILRLG